MLETFQKSGLFLNVIFAARGSEFFPWKTILKKKEINIFMSGLFA